MIAVLQDDLNCGFLSLCISSLNMDICDQRSTVVKDVYPKSYMILILIFVDSF